MVEDKGRDEHGFPIAEKHNYELLSEDELIQEDISKKEYLVSGLGIEKGKIILIASPTGVAKTWVSLELSVKIAQGRAAFNNSKFATIKSKVLYVDLENGRDELARRYWRLTDKKSGNFYHITNNEIKDNGKVITMPSMAIDSQKDTFLKDILMEKIKGGNYGLVVFDPLIFISEGDENSTNDMRNLFKIFKDLCFLSGVTILVNHHINKGKYEDEMNAIRGNTAIVGACDYIYFMKRHKEEDYDDNAITNESVIEVINIKQRGALRKPAFVISMADSYDGRKTNVIYEGLLKDYKNHKIYRCRADILRYMGLSLSDTNKFVETKDVIKELNSKYSDAVIEKAIKELKEEKEIELYDNKEGKLKFTDKNTSN